MQQSPSSNRTAEKKFPAFYGTQSFINVFTTPRNLPQSWASWSHFTTPNLLLLQPFILLSHPRLCFHISLFTSDFPTKTLHAFLFSTTRAACATYLFIIDLITPIILIRRTKFWSSSLCRLYDMKAWFWIAKWRSLIIIIRSWHI